MRRKRRRKRRKRRRRRRRDGRSRKYLSPKFVSGQFAWIFNGDERE